VEAPKDLGVQKVVAETVLVAAHNMYPRRPLSWYIVWGLACLVGASIFYYGYLYLVKPAATKPTVAYQLRNEDPQFKEGLGYMKDGSFDKASQVFKEALLKSQDFNQEAFIKYHIGYAQGLAKDYSESITTLRSVAANENYPDIYRAWSVQMMSELYYINGKDPNLAKYVFDAPPYSGFKDEVSVEASYARLSEYANSFYPVAGALFRVVYNKVYPAIISIQKDGITQSEEAELKDLWAQMHEAIRIGEDELVTSREVGFDNSSLSYRVVRQAGLYAMATMAGEDHAADADRLYKEGLELSSSNSDQRLWAGYNYAVYLSQKYGKSRAVDISSALAPFFEPAYRNERFYKYFSREETKIDVQTRINIERISLVDEKFAELMRSLGWKV